MNKRQTLFLHKQCFWFNQVQVTGVYIYLAVSLFLKKKKRKNLGLNGACHFQLKRNSQTPKAQFEI